MKTSPGRSVIFILISLLILANASCNRTGGAKKTRLAFITNNASDFWTIARKGAEKAAAELPNVEVEFKINSEGTAPGNSAWLTTCWRKALTEWRSALLTPKIRFR